MGKSFDQGLRKLDKWYQKESRVLPWREDSSFYRVWVSEIMLQQTQVTTVTPYFERFMKKFESVADLAHATEEEVMKQWAGLGYYSRARNLHQAAKIFAANGFPSTLEGWLEMPGVGPYTAGAVLSIAGNQPEAILDGNVERVLCRVQRLSRDSEKLWSESRKWITRAVFLKIKPRVFNQALMEVGALVCTPKNPKCGICPVSSICQARLKKVIENYPPPKPKKKWIAVSETRVCILSKDRKILLVQGQEGAWRKGLWDFPTEFPARLLKGKKMETVVTKHVVTNHKITRQTQVYQISVNSNSKNQRWVSIEDIDLPVGSAFKKTWKAISSLPFLEAHLNR